ncbi:MAG: short-chain dehydrogenase, partial [Myxococcales bacterium]|nr:short-chain dehydrogenase [Myxococcales bacterium]
NRAYGDSKLANLYFTYELARRYDGSLISVAAHPGATQTELARHTLAIRIFNVFAAQKLSVGTLPTLRAATDPEAESGDYYGPDGLLEVRGYPVKVESNALSHDATLWWRA